MDMICHATFYWHQNKETVLQDQYLPLIDRHSAVGQESKECSKKISSALLAFFCSSDSCVYFLDVRCHLDLNGPNTSLSSGCINWMALWIILHNSISFGVGFHEYIVINMATYAVNKAKLHSLPLHVDQNGPSFLCICNISSI